MKQIYHPYTEWEDFQNGMYDEVKEGRADRVKKAAEILCDLSLLYEQMRRVTLQWKCATEQTLTNMSINHKAFLGQAACSIYAGIHEDEVREAWGYLTNEQRFAANQVAERVDREWRKEYIKQTDDYQLSIFD